MVREWKLTQLAKQRHSRDQQHLGLKLGDKSRSDEIRGEPSGRVDGGSDVGRIH